MQKRAVGLGLVIAALLTMVACGSDKKRLTSAELTTQGNAVCTKLDTEVKALADTFPVTVTFTPAQMQDFYKKILPLVDKAVSGFKSLTPPKDLEDVYDAALTQVGLDRKTLAGATNSPEAAQKLFDVQEDPFTATNQKLAAAGITACGGAPAASGGATDQPSTSVSPITSSTLPPTTAK